MLAVVLSSFFIPKVSDQQKVLAGRTVFYVIDAFSKRHDFFFIVFCLFLFVAEPEFVLDKRQRIIEILKRHLPNALYEQHLVEVVFGQLEVPNL